MCGVFFYISELHNLQKMNFKKNYGNNRLGGVLNMKSLHSKEKKKNMTKGFYVALCVCIAAIGATAITTYDTFMNHSKKKSGRLSEPQTASQAPPQQANNEVHGITIPEHNTVDSKKIIKSDPIEKDFDDFQENEITVENHKESNLIVNPCSKEIIKEYSGENPVFSKTMNDWRIHSGVDFKAEQGQKILSITNGKVLDVYEDALLGKTIEIKHSNGVTAYYSGLGDTTMVNKDEEVEPGQEIGSINDVPSEILDGYHLHLAMKKDGKFINPIDVLPQ